MTKNKDSEVEKRAADVREELERLHDLRSLLPILLHQAAPDLPKEDFYRMVVLNDSYEFLTLVKRLAQEINWDLHFPLKDLLNDTVEPKTRFFLFLLLLQFYDVQGFHKQMETLHDDQHERFSTEGNVMQYAVATVLLRSRNQGEVLKGLNILDELVQACGDGVNPEFLQAYSEGATRVLEGRMMPRHLKDELVKKAMRRIDQAIMMTKERSDYYFTRTTLLTMAGDLDQARSDLELAIGCEDPLARSYSERVIEYRLKLLQIEHRKGLADIDSLETKIESVRKQILEDRWRVIEFVGVFSALIALVLSSVSLTATTSLPLRDSLQLLLALGGMLIILVETMMIRLVDRSDRIRLAELILFILAGFALIWLAFWL